MIFVALHIYLKALPNMVGQPQQLKANYSGLHPMWIIFLKGYSVLVRVEIIHKSKFLPGTVEKNSSTIRSSDRNRLGRRTIRNRIGRRTIRSSGTALTTKLRR